MKALIAKRWFKKEDGPPLYVQIADFLGAAIKEGVLPQNSILPGHRQLAAMLGVGINTVLHALHMLEHQNLLVLSERSRPVVAQTSANAPDWDGFISKSACSIFEQNFYYFPETRSGTINLSMGLARDYFFRHLFSEVMGSVSFSNEPTSPYGLPALREKICENNKPLGIDARPEQVMIVTSVTQALNVIFLSLLGRGSTLLIAEPNILQVSNLVRATRCAVAGLKMDEFGITPLSLTKALQKHGQCVLCVSPDCNVPTGDVMPAERRRDLLTICNKNRVPVIEHTVFPLKSTLSDIPSMKSMDTTDSVIHLSQVGVSTFTNPWLGWVIMDEVLLRKMQITRFNFDAHQNFIMQLAALEIFNNGAYDRHLEHLCRVRLERQAATSALLEQHLKPYATWNRDNLDACVWLKFDKTINVARLTDAAADITFQPGALYGQQYQDRVYLSPLAVSAENYAFGMKALGNAAAVVRKNAVK